MLKNLKNFKRNVFSDISKAKHITLKIAVFYAIINSIMFIGHKNLLISAEASPMNISSNYNTEENVIFIPASESVPNVTVNNKEIICSATAYTGGGRTSSGILCRRDPNGISTISVDPSVIPIGTKVYIEGYGYAVAADTGSSVKGNKIDVYFNSVSECYNWGNKSVKVTILGNS